MHECLERDACRPIHPRNPARSIRELARGTRYANSLHVI